MCKSAGQSQTLVRALPVSGRPACVAELLTVCFPSLPPSVVDFFGNDSYQAQAAQQVQTEHKSSVSALPLCGPVERNYLGPSSVVPDGAGSSTSRSNVALPYSLATK